MADVRIGISGWTYAPWRKTFYPEGLPHRRELAHAAGLLHTIEINGSFYALQKPSSYRRWFTDTPADFMFSVKAPRFITHMKKLKDVETPVANFFASDVLALEQKLGPVLWQLPPSLGFNQERLRTFFDLLPRTTAHAARLAERHDERMENRAWTSTEVDRPLRHVLEVRHDSFRTPEFAKLLREHDIGLVVADTAGRWPQFDEVTATRSSMSVGTARRRSMRGPPRCGPGRRGATMCSSISTTTRRCTRRSTPWRWRARSLVSAPVRPSTTRWFGRRPCRAPSAPRSAGTSRRLYGS